MAYLAQRVRDLLFFGRWNCHRAATYGLIMLLAFVGAATGQNRAGQWFPARLAA
jgi:hypothetical protein